MLQSVLCCWGVDFGLLMWIREVWWPFKDICDCYCNEERRNSAVVMRQGLILNIAISLCLCFCLKLNWFFFPQALWLQLKCYNILIWVLIPCIAFPFYLPEYIFLVLKPAGFVHAALNKLFPSYIPQAAGKTSQQVVVQTAKQRIVQCCMQRDLWNPKSTLGLQR